ncbi:MAG: NosD domain-containing protein [Methanobacterium sp.]
MFKRKRYIILVLMILFFALSISNTVTAKDWNNTTIENNTGNGQSSIAVDNNGNIHISYYNATNGDLGYAVKTKTDWVYETTDIAGCNPSLALDNNGNPHICYNDYVNDKLAYATKSGDSWIYEDLNSSLYGPWSGSLKIDADGNPNIIYTDSNLKLRYAKKVNGTWIYELVHYEKTGIKPILVIDNDNSLHIVFSEQASYLGGNDYLAYAKKNATGWSVDIRLATNPHSASIIIDNNNKPVICFQNNNGLFKLVKSGSIWNSYTIDSQQNVGEPYLAKDINGDINLIYCDYSKYGIIYAKEHAGTWNKEIVTIATTNSLTYPSLDLDNNCSPHIMFYNANNKNLVYTVLERPTASANPNGGLYNTDLAITLTMNENGTIYYTRNGLDPTTSSYLYSSPIIITDSKIIKYIAVDSFGHQSMIYTQNYSINKTIPIINSRTGISYNVIQAAIDDINTHNGDTLSINNQTYYENISLNKKLNLMGYNTVLQANNKNLPVIRITLEGSGSTIQGLYINGSSNSQIYIDTATGIKILNNTINGNLNSSKSLWGICLVNSDQNDITNNTVINCEEGINLYNTNNTKIMYNNVKNCHWDNIALNLSILNIITGNNITNADSGIRLIGGSNNNTISNNNLTANIWTSISLVNSLFNQVTSNVLSSNQEGIYLYASNNNTINNNTANNNIWDGIAVHDSSNNLIKGHTNITGNNCGVRIIGTSSNNEVIDNNINGNLWSNLSIDTSTTNIIHNNTLNNGNVGLYLQGSSNNQIYNNTIQNNAWDGIDLLYGSNNNTIHNNNISGSYYGERTLNSNNNTSYKNNYMNNVIQANDNGTNNWDNSITGNYWSDWLSLNPRQIDGGSNVDNHPTLAPF